MKKYKKIIYLVLFAFVPLWSDAQQVLSSLNDKKYTKYYVLDATTNKKELLVDFISSNSSVEFDVEPKNSSAQVGALLRYIDKNNWIYVGCDNAADHLGFAHWYVETPLGKTEIAKDIAKLYANYKRRIKINCAGKNITVYIDGEKIAHQNIDYLPTQAGKIGFRVHDKGNVEISNIIYKSIDELPIKENKKKKYYSISSSKMQVLLDMDFPSVNSYLWKNNSAKLYGQRFDMKYITINGENYLPKVTVKKQSNTILYHLDIPEIHVSMDVCCEVKENIFQLSLKNIKEENEFKVHTIGFPNHHLVSTSHVEPNATLSVARSVYSDTICSLKSKQLDNTYQFGSIVFLNTDKLVATLESNSIYNTRQFVYQSVRTKKADITGIWGNDWIYRGLDNSIVDLPYIKVILSDDCNQDDQVNWQDGAVALQEVYPKPFGTDWIQNSYATITMNFASCAQYPFLRQLDNIKKFYLATDGFGQMLELKGYQSEGHDSGHPDYSQNYNERAGGQNDLAFLAKEAKKYNARIGVHINHSESYPEAKAFNHKVITDMPAWAWLDQSYFINKEADLLSGDFEERLNQLKIDVPDLSFIYLDTYREYRWLASQTAKFFNKNGWTIWTEDANVFDKEATWIHYTPESKSLIHRFVHHQYRDGYAKHSLLLGGYNRGASIGFMGWQKGRDFNGVLQRFYLEQLPYRYLMHFKLLELKQNRVRFEKGVVSELDKLNGKPRISRRDYPILIDSVAFIPWDPIKEDKIYYYNLASKSMKWKLPISWRRLPTVQLYKLTDLGRIHISEIKVSNGEIELDTHAKTGYIIYKDKAPLQNSMLWGEGGHVRNPGFDGRIEDDWNISDNVSISTTDYGQRCLKITSLGEISQTVESLQKGGEYSISVWCEVNSLGSAKISIGDKQHVITKSNMINYTDNSDKYGTKYQRMKLYYKHQGTEDPTLKLSFNSCIDTAYAAFDDVRITAYKAGFHNNEHYYYEDFEDVDEGWGAFIPAKASSFMTHLSEKHTGYTDDTIDGNWSLKTRNEPNGEVLRTNPAMLDFRPNTDYSLSFEYSVTKDDVYKVIVRSNRDNKEILNDLLNKKGLYKGRFTTLNTDDYYLVITKNGGGELILDNVTIDEI